MEAGLHNKKPTTYFQLSVPKHTWATVIISFGLVVLSSSPRWKWNTGPRVIIRYQVNQQCLSMSLRVLIDHILMLTLQWGEQVIEYPRFKAHQHRQLSTTSVKLPSHLTRTCP